MPEESVAAYINNTITLVIFILACMIIFVLIFLVSAGIRKKVLARNQRTSRIYIDVDMRGDGFNKANTSDYQSVHSVDPFIRKNIALFVSIFIFTILSVILALAVFYYSRNIGINPGLYMIGILLLGFLIVLIFITRSGTINK